MKEVENRRRKLLEQITVIFRASGLADLAYFRGELLADARHRAQLLVGAGAQPVGGVRDGVGRVSVRADFEGILVFDFEQVGNLRKYSGYGEVFHLRSL